MNNEVWKDVRGYEGYYQVSNFGNVKSLDRAVETNRGGICIVKGRLLVSNKKNSNDHPQVILYMKGKPKGYLVRNLVFTHFVTELENDDKVVHKDYNKKNNHISNLMVVKRRSKKVR